MRSTRQRLGVLAIFLISLASSRFAALADDAATSSEPPLIDASVALRDNRSPHRPRFTNNSGLARGPEAGLRQGNGDIFTSFWNDRSKLVWSVGKTDVWDRRYYGNEKNKKVITLDDIKRYVNQDNPERLSERPSGFGTNFGYQDSPNSLCRAYDFPCPKPVGQILLSCPALDDIGAYKAVLDLDHATMNIEGVKDSARLKIENCISALRNIILFHVDCADLPGNVLLELYRHRDTLVFGKTVMTESGSYDPFPYDYSRDKNNGPMDPPETGHDGPFFWIRQRFPQEATYPQGFECVMMATIPDAKHTVSLQENVLGEGGKVTLKELPANWNTFHGSYLEKRYAIEQVNNAPGWSAKADITTGDTSSFNVYISIMTTRDAADPFAAAKAALQDAVKAGPDAIVKEHRDWWSHYYSRSSIQTGQPGLDRGWYSGLYGAACNSRIGKLPMYNATAPLFTDATPWHGDYHFNESILYGSLISNHAETLMPWLDMLEEMLPMAKNNAREVYNCRGCCYPLVHYPIKSERVAYSNQTWELGIELTAMCLKPFWQYCMYTGDFDYLRNHAYPIMREGALFYEDYVTLGDDGYYHIIPTVSQENWGVTKKFEKNRDSVGALSQVKYHLLACAEAAEILGVDADQRARWRDIAAKLAPYPTYKTDQGLIFVDVRDAEPSKKLNTHADLSMITFGDQIHLESDPELQEIARRTYEIMYPGGRRDRAHYNGIIERRLGLERKVGFFDAEDLLMSFTGRMYFFFGLPNSPNARFDRLLAWGGFEVTAEKKDGQVALVEIKSLAGQPCKFKNPWQPNKPRVVAVSDNTDVPLKIDGDTVTFDTQRDMVYRVTPPQPASP